MKNKKWLGSIMGIVVVVAIATGLFFWHYQQEKTISAPFTNHDLQTYSKEDDRVENHIGWEVHLFLYQNQARIILANPSSSGKTKNNSTAEAVFAAVTGKKTSPSLKSADLTEALGRTEVTQKGNKVYLRSKKLRLTFTKDRSDDSYHTPDGTVWMLTNTNNQNH